MKQTYLVIGFETTTMAMRMERACAEQGEPGRLIPLPTEISAGCGMAWASTLRDEAHWAETMRGSGIRWQLMREVIW